MTTLVIRLVRKFSHTPITKDEVEEIMRRAGLVFLTFFIFFIYNLAQGSYSIEHPEVRSISSGGYLFTEVVDDLLTVDIRDVPLEEVLKHLSDQNGITFFLSPSLGKEKVMVRFSNFKIDDGLNKILASYNRIFIYSKEDCNSHEPPTTRLTEVRIYPRFQKTDKQGKLAVTPGIHSKASQHSLENKDTKRYGMKDSGVSGGKKSVETLSKSMKNKNFGARGRDVKQSAMIGKGKAARTLASTIKNKNQEVNKESDKTLQKMGEDLNEENDDDFPPDADEEEEPVPSDGGSPNFDIDVSNDSQGQGKEIAIQLNDVPEQLLTAGFLITYDPSNVSIANVDVHDGSALTGPWDRDMTKKYQDANGPGTYMVACGNLGNATPDSDSTINLAKVRFTCNGNCDSSITISTIPGFNTVGGANSGHIYDSSIKPITVSLH